MAKKIGSFVSYKQTVGKPPRMARITGIVEHKLYGTLLEIRYLDGDEEPGRICASAAKAPVRGFKPRPEHYGTVARRKT